MIYAVLLLTLFFIAGWWILLPKACPVCGGESHIWDEATKQAVCLKCELLATKGSEKFKPIIDQSAKKSHTIYLKLNLKSKKATFLMHEGIKSQNAEYLFQVANPQEWDLSDELPVN